jgi:hypothetical protein
VKKAPKTFYSNEQLAMAQQFIINAIKDSFEINCPITLNNSMNPVPCWNKELSKLRVEVRKLFNRARNTSKVGVRELFREAQRSYRKAIVG